MIAGADLARGRKASGKNVSKEVTYFLFAKEFGWAPDVVDRQDSKNIAGISTIMSAYNKILNAANKKK